MIDGDPCLKHPSLTIRSICKTEGCLDRILCPVCQASHPKSHALIQWQVKAELIEIRRRWTIKQAQRLEAMQNLTLKKLAKQLQKVINEVQMKISLGFSDVFKGFSQVPDISSQVQQFTEGSINDLSAKNIQDIMQTLKRIEDSDFYQEKPHISAAEQEMIKQMCEKMAKQMKNLKKIYWGMFNFDINLYNQEKPINKSGVFTLLGIKKPTLKQSFEQLYQNKKRQLEYEEDKLLKKVYQVGKQDIAVNGKSFTDHKMEALCDRLVGNSQIRSIALVNCDITSINPFRLLNHTAFQNLRSLNLSRNQIVTLLPLANLALPNLQDLNLQSNGILSLDPLVKCSCPHLQILNLSSNKFNKIDAISFMPFEQMLQMTMNYNTIQTLQPFSRSSFPNIKFIRLAGVVVIDKKTLADYHFQDERLRNCIWFT